MSLRHRLLEEALLLFVFFPGLCLTQEESQDKCDPSQEHNYALTTRYDDRSCLFEVWGIRKKVNVKQADGFAFDRDLAEAICRYHNGTFPIIDSEEKERFLLDIWEDEGAYVLGLEHRGEKTRWASGYDVTYANPDWKKDDSGCHYTLLVQSESADYWQDVPCNSIRGEHVIVLCEESHDGQVALNRPEKPPWDLYDKCDPMNEYKFRRARKYEDHTCYFEVDGADEMVNAATDLKEHGVTYFSFDIETARWVCSNHSATLAILRNKEEERFLLDFVDQNMNYVALGLHKTESGYEWDDGTPRTYSNPDWRKGNKNGTSYTLLVSSIAEAEVYWMDVPMDEPIPNGVQVICQERYRHPSALNDRPILNALHKPAESAKSGMVRKNGASSNGVLRTDVRWLGWTVLALYMAVSF